MKNVLMIAHQFPPMGGSGIQRTVKFIKFLPGCGYSPVVLTRRQPRAGLRDESLSEELPPGLPVYRTHAFDPEDMPGLLRYPGKGAARLLFLPDAAAMWAACSTGKACALLTQYGAPILYTTSSPYSAHLLGLRVKARLPQVKWVCDFRDEWTKNPYLLDRPHPALRTRLEQAMEQRVLRHCDYLIANTPVMLSHFKALLPELERKSICIPNGFDPEDFEDLQDVYRKNEVFTITYAGLLYGRRSPRTLFDALGLLLRERRIKPEHIRVCLIGNFKLEALRSMAAENKLDSVVTFSPYMAHRECLGVLARSDCVLLLEGDGPGAEAFYTGKVFEYLNIGRPILAVIPAQGAAAELVRRTNTGIVAAFSDVRGIADTIACLYEGWLRGEIPYRPNRAEISRYTRQKLTEQLGAVFDALL